MRSMKFDIKITCCGSEPADDICIKLESQNLDCYNIDAWQALLTTYHKLQENGHYLAFINISPNLDDEDLFGDKANTNF